MNELGGGRQFRHNKSFLWNAVKFCSDIDRRNLEEGRHNESHVRVGNTKMQESKRRLLVNEQMSKGLFG